MMKMHWMEMASSDYYAVLGLATEASASEIRRAYLKRAKECHPDKNPDDEAAKEQFQHLQKIYHVLSSPTKRAIYDRDGAPPSDNDECDGDGGTITEEDIHCFAREYLTSEVERDDLFEHYKMFKGDMRKVFTFQILSDNGLDAHRFRRMILEGIESGELKMYKTFEKWSEKVLKMKEVKFDFEDRMQQPATESNHQLISLIKNRSRGAQFKSHLEDLEARYCTGEDTKHGDIDDEEFERIQSQLKSSKRTRDRGGEKQTKKRKKSKKGM